MTFPTYLVGSTEYVIADVTGDVVLNTQVVTIVIDGTEHPATWMGTQGTSRSCRTTDPIEFADPLWVDDLYEIAVRYVDSPEEPLFSAGYIRVKA